jgi:hypothetical protein
VSLSVSPKMSMADAGRRGARARWGPPRTLRLDTLDSVTRGIVTEILRARENAKAAAALDPATALPEVRRDRATSTG